MNYLDLFAGVGGFALGAYWAGMKFDSHYCSDIEPSAVELYKKRFPESIQLGDIKEIDCEKLANAASVRCDMRRPKGERIQREKQPCNEIDTSGQSWIITGGFPCQDISIAGKGDGITGARSGLWFEYWRIIRDLRPGFAIMENVGALTFRGLTDVLGSLAEIGYDAEWQDIRAEDLGAPHRRERIWIVAYPNGNGTQRDKPEHREGCGIESCGEEIPDTSRELQHRTRQPGTTGWRELTDSNWWELEPSVGRLAHGVPGRVDRLRGLGNSIVPQIAEILFNLIKDECYDT